MNTNTEASEAVKIELGVGGSAVLGAAGCTITKLGNIITDAGYEPSAQDRMAAESIRKAHKMNVAARAARSAR